MRIAAIIGLTVALPSGVFAQATGLGASGMGGQKHLDMFGKPCLESTGSGTPLPSNPRIFNHSVILDNHCSDRIKAKVCYYQSDDCTLVEVPGHSRKEQIIGVFPATDLFRFEVKEQFSQF